MSIICGVEIKSKTAVLVVLNGNKEEFKIQESKPLKIELEDSCSQECIKSFSNAINEFLQNEKIEKIFIKEGIKKGKFTSGSPVFKIEAILQMSDVEVELVNALIFKNYIKKVSFDLNDHTLKKYQQIAYEVAYYGLV